jgi:hypothetical protein
MKRIWILIILLLAGCVSREIKPSSEEYYYQKKLYNGYLPDIYATQPKRITKTEYRTTSLDIQSMYERVEGDECNDIHCNQL